MKTTVLFLVIFVFGCGGSGSIDGGGGGPGGGGRAGGGTDRPVAGNDGLGIDAAVVFDAAFAMEAGRDGTGGSSADSGTVTDGSAAGSTLRVFFIGNSYTHRNLMPGIFTQLAKASGVDVVWDWRAPGGSSLADSYDGIGSVPSALPRVQKGDWDYVVMQEQSTTPLTDRSEFLASAKRWDTELDRAGVKGIFLMTWARKAAPDTQIDLTSAYVEAARAASAATAPAGEAWKSTWTEHPELELYGPDGSHPAVLGSYLVACTLYATIFRKSPEGLPGRFTAIFAPGVPLFGQPASGDFLPRMVDIPSATATLLQRTAWKVSEAFASPR
jgi:hypothetical protein